MPSGRSKSLKSKSKGSSKASVDNACCVYDFTLFDELEVQTVRDVLGKYCKKYCFQLEKGEATGRPHYQGRISLKIKKRQSELIKQLKPYWRKYHVSVTSNANKNNNFYVMKDDTRESGPYTDENEVYIPRDIRNIDGLYAWQTQLRNMLKEYDERRIDVIYDVHGNRGKTTLARYMMLYDDAEMLPFCNDHKDVMRMAFDVGPKKVYLIDMPRASDKTKLYQFYSGVEMLKSGFCYDDRYKFQRRLFDRPRICIFTNTLPDQQLLSKDMWCVWQIYEDEMGVCSLVPFGSAADEYSYGDVSAEMSDSVVSVEGEDSLSSLSKDDGTSISSSFDGGLQAFVPLPSTFVPQGIEVNGGSVDSQVIDSRDPIIVGVSKVKESGIPGLVEIPTDESEFDIEIVSEHNRNSVGNDLIRVSKNNIYTIPKERFYPLVSSDGWLNRD